MEYKDENLQEEQGSMQRQSQVNDQFNEAEEQEKNSGGAGIVPTPEVKGSDADQDRGGESSLEDVEASEDRDDYISSRKSKRRSWNSITFDHDDFVSGLMPA